MRLPRLQTQMARAIGAIEWSTRKWSRRPISRGSLLSASSRRCSLRTWLTDQRWAADRLGPERVKGAYAWHTMEDDGVHFAFGTDYPVEPINPLRGIYACVTREFPDGGPPGGWQPQEKLPMDDCLRAYTAGSAYAEFEEKQKGAIAPGMLADIVVFPVDITRIPPRELLSTHVAMTIAGGRIVFERQR